jgi:hypothetical protein
MVKWRQLVLFWGVCAMEAMLVGIRTALLMLGGLVLGMWLPVKRWRMGKKKAHRSGLGGERSFSSGSGIAG